MPIESGRRKLRFNDLQEVVRDVEALRSGGYRRVGRWDLSQACGHLAAWMTYPVDGYPPVPFFLRPLLFLLKRTVVPGKLRRALETGEVGAGSPTLPATVPSPGGDEAEAVERLRRAVERFEAHQGPYRPSSLFGDLDRETCRRLQLVHCAHHLGYLLPGADPG